MNGEKEVQKRRTKKLKIDEAGQLVYVKGPEKATDEELDICLLPERGTGPMRLLYNPATDSLRLEAVPA